MGEEELVEKLFQLTCYTLSAGKLDEVEAKKSFQDNQKTFGISPCKECYLSQHRGKVYKTKDCFYNKVPVPIVLFPFSLENYRKIKNKIQVMVISRDPNFKKYDSKGERNKNGKIRFIWGKFIEEFENTNQAGLLSFVHNLCNKLGVWKKYISFLQEIKLVKTGEIKIKDTNIPSVYWTHLVKCYTYNNKKNVNLAKNSCVEILKEEINFLSPKIIIGLGEDVGKTLNALYGTDKGKISMDEWLQKFQEFKGKLFVILPHPSGQSPYKYDWKNLIVYPKVKEKANLKGFLKYTKSSM